LIPMAKSKGKRQVSVRIGVGADDGQGTTTRAVG